MPWISTVCGVDFSGAAESGRNAWLARLDVTGGSPGLRLADLKPIGKLARADDRASVCGYLVDRILASRQTLWGMDFPFGLPVELGLGEWSRQLSDVARFDGTAKEYGRSLVQRAESRLGRKHVRRATDTETKTPFDCYHYRIIYQTFHGMRDVLNPIAEDASTAVLPFRYDRAGEAERVVVEACPASTLKRLRLPHQRYKQPTKKYTDRAHRKVRRTILGEIEAWVSVSRYRREMMLRNPGGDAMDAVVAAVGSWQALGLRDHVAIAAHRRYRHEGFVYA